MYNITQYTKDKADKIGVIVKPSTNKNKKIDVFSKQGEKLASIGAIGFMDYPNYIKTKGLTYANERKRLYLKRHSKEVKEKDGKFTPSYWSKVLLW